MRVGIAHIGVGNFHRTHQAVYLDRCLHRPGHEGWGLLGVGLGDGPQARAKAEAFWRQDGLYTVTEFDPRGRVSVRVIGAMVDYLHAPSDPAAVLDRLTSPDLRIVTLTITESGYNFDEATGAFRLDPPDVAHDLAGGAPRTAFGFLVAALEQRRAAGVTPFTVVSCDNLRHNGDTMRRAVVAFAQARDPALASWIEREVAFPNSMVDRIAPRVSADDRERLNQRSGIDDLLPAMGESYLQWVMEDRFPAGRPALDQVGVELRDDVALFEAVKGRLLNASHMLMSYPVLLCGHRLVHQAMANARIAGLLDAFMEQDAIPLLDGPPGVSLRDYKAMVIERFSNPAVADQLLRIAHDGAAKIPVFHAKTLSTMVERGADLNREAFFLACFGRYLRGRDDHGAGFRVFEPGLSPQDLTLQDDLDGLGLLRMTPFRGLALDRDLRFAAAFIAASATLTRIGTAAALDELLAP